MAVYTREGIQKLASVAWSAITGIPDRVSELAALGDPGGLRFLIWDNLANEIAYYEPEAADIAYDNAMTALIATTVQGAIDELFDLISAAGVFVGYVDSGAAAERLPAGWSVTADGGGVYTVTHGGGYADEFTLGVVASVVLGAGDDRYCNVIPVDGNSFRVSILDQGAGGVDDDFFFIAKVIE